MSVYWDELYCGICKTLTKRWTHDALCEPCWQIDDAIRRLGNRVCQNGSEWCASPSGYICQPCAAEVAEMQ